VASLNFAYPKRRSYTVCVLKVSYFILTPYTHPTRQTIKAVVETHFKIKHYNKLLEVIIHYVAITKGRT
jgi:hypothetical protein